MTRYFYLYEEQTEDGRRFYVENDEGDGTFIRGDAHIFSDDTVPIFPIFDREYLPGPPAKPVLIFQLWEGDC